MNINHLVLTIGLVSSPLVFAESQWGSDPRSYLTVAEEADASKSAVDSKGNIITGFSVVSERFDFHLAKFDREGNQLWNGESVLVKDRNTSFILKWDLEIGKDDAIYTAFDDVWASKTYIAKTNSDGTLAWMVEPGFASEAGVSRSNLARIHPNDHGVAFTHRYRDYNYITQFDVGLIRDDGFKGSETFEGEEPIEEIIAGEAYWVKPFSSTDKSYTSVDVITVNDGIIVLSMGQRDEDGANALYAQKYDFEGNEIWGEEPILLMDGPNKLPGSGVPVIHLVDDGLGGVAYATRLPGNFAGDLYFQHVNANGDRLYKGAGARISSNFDSEYYDVANPTIALHDKTFVVGWTALGGAGPFYDYAVFYQGINRDGSFVLENPKAIIKVQDFEPVEGNIDEDLGVLSGGHISVYKDQISIAYAKSTDYSQTAAEIRRVDFTLDGEIVRDVSVANPNLWLSTVSPVISPFGELITTFKAGLEVSSDKAQTEGADRTYLQSVTPEGTIGISEGVRLSWPQTTWFVAEDNIFSTVLQIADTNELLEGESYSVTALSDDDEHTVEAQLENGEILLTVAPKAEFSGQIKVSVTATHSIDSTRTTTNDYILYVTNVNDEPTIDLIETITASEDTLVDVVANVVDVDNENLSITWNQVSGQSVDFSTEQSQLSFQTPVLLEDTELKFELIVSDTESSVSKILIVNVTNDKEPTIRMPNVSVIEGGTTVISPVLSGLANIKTVNWRKISGAELTLASTEQLNLNITSPFVRSDEVAVLELTVTDSLGQTTSQQVSVTIESKKSSSGGTNSWGLLLCLAGLSIRKVVRKQS
ncbi:hypothetical protein [Litorilituus lipolyticus]|uniref:Uncharacterized protein n=1 Tax=Litorilituus lipolyticus TaxID=2491017 RepID=A0A502L1P6_9GAMM|nr:hypothetical protein [Litorilituus lipolyticus]TPH17114.1 hypothetical protein EPA86_05375 [Litorilituus lipolyticus]